MLAIGNMQPCQAAADNVETGRTICCCDCDYCRKGKGKGNLLCCYCASEHTPDEHAARLLGDNVQPKGGN